LTRIRLSQLRREVGDTDAARSAIEAAAAWLRASGGGQEANLAECLLAAMDAEDGTPGAAHRLASVLATARDADDPEVQVLALDAMAALSAVAGEAAEASEFLTRSDAVMSSAGHRVTERDRLDARRARELLRADPAASAST